MTNTHKTKYKSYWNIKNKTHFNNMETRPKTVRITDPTWEARDPSKGK